MPTFIYRCPTTGYRVQGYTPDEVKEEDDNIFESVHCPVCKRIHLVNPLTGEVAGEQKK